MRITTWNVNGIRAVLKKDGFNWLEAHQPDILCLQEIKARPEQLGIEDLADFEGYHACWHPAERPGYSGVVTFSRSEPPEQRCGMGREDFDREGRLIWQRIADPEPGGDFLLFNIYFPNGQRDQGRLDYKLDFYAALLELCDRLHASGEKVILTGDFNTAHREIDLANPKSNATTSGFLPEERAWIDRYLHHGFVDAYRQLYPDKVEYTWWTYITNARARNVGWRLDYYLVSQALMPRIQDVLVHGEITGSDHCPVTLLIR
jgi:exodeoxyribonuclease III